MKLLIDFFPIALFFAAFKVWDIYVATGVAIVATLAQIEPSAGSDSTIDVASRLKQMW